MDDSRESNENAPGETHRGDGSHHHHGSDEHGGTVDESDDPRIEQELLEDEAEGAEEGEPTLHEQYEHAGDEDEGDAHGVHGGLHLTVPEFRIRHYRLR